MIQRVFMFVISNQPLALPKQLNGSATRDLHFRWSGLLLNMNCNLYQAFIFQGKWQNTNYKYKENNMKSVIDVFVIILDK